MPDLHYTSLDDLTVLDVRGADTLRFLQGQVSHDVELLADRGSLMAGLSNAQGRVLAVLRLFYVAPEQVLVVLPAELAESIRLLLHKYILRAKVTIATAGTAWRVYGITGPDAGAAAVTRLYMTMDAGGWRQLIVAPRGEALPEADPASRDTWRLADIEAGVPELFAATSGSFLAQMLNLDLLDAISLTKGCYTGQEVIARTHYRGQVKRRMQRFLTDSVRTLNPGERVQLRDGRVAQIVMAAGDAAGQQFLAVTQMTLAAANEDATPVGTVSTLDCHPLPLPYVLPQ